MAYDGWRCPQCGGVFSPFTPRCMNCYGQIPTYFGTNTSDLKHCLNCGQVLTPNHRCVVSYRSAP